MDKIFEKTLLFDFYGELLTDRQKELYQMYHLEDLSLGEISEQLSISRQGVYDAIKRCDKQLSHFEDKLQLVHRYVRNKDRAERIYALAKTIQKEHSIAEVDEIKKITKEIISDM